MLPAPRADLVPNTFEYEVTPLVKTTGFREYDARWLFGPEINLLGVEALGLGLGTYIQELGQTKIVVGHDYRSYSLSIKQALTVGLVAAGCEVVDIGLALSPVAYFAQFALDAPCVAMVTASHNENGWTGVKMGAQRPLTFGPVEISRYDLTQAAPTLGSKVMFNDTTGEIAFVSSATAIPAGGMRRRASRYRNGAHSIPAITVNWNEPATSHDGPLAAAKLSGA